jgi:hypothetical protein
MYRDGLAPETLRFGPGGVTDWSSRRIDARSRIVVARLEESPSCQLPGR